MARNLTPPSALLSFATANADACRHRDANSGQPEEREAGKPGFEALRGYMADYDSLISQGMHANSVIESDQLGPGRG